MGRCRAAGARHEGTATLGAKMKRYLKQVLNGKGTHPSGSVTSPYGDVREVFVRRFADKNGDVNREQQVVLSHHEEDRKVLLPFPFLRPD